MDQLNHQSSRVVDVAIVGSGPYGLSIAAHLAARQIPFRIFGKPMGFWSDQMPQGMKLKSDGFASSLSDPQEAFTLKAYCLRQGLPYADTGLPVPLETFVSYGAAFQRELVPNLEENRVTLIRRSNNGFQVRLDTGEEFWAREVVVAVGIAEFEYIPEVLSEMPAELVTHSSAHSDLQKFANRRVAVIGAGASALDLAALLNKAHASVQVVVRGSTVRFFDPPQPRSLRERVFSPLTGLGTGFDFLFYAKAPHIFRLLPEKLRLNRVQKTLGPRPGWFVRDEVVGKVPILYDASITQATVKNGCVVLELKKDNETVSIEFDHVIAATGYRVDLQRMGMLSDDLRQEIRLTGTAPFLSSHFESSVPGLYFAGVVAANTFGPLMRFAYGTEFTARRLSTRLAKAARKFSVPIRQPEAQRVLD